MGIGLKNNCRKRLKSFLQVQVNASSEGAEKNAAMHHLKSSMVYNPRLTSKLAVNIK